jgi:hypothetical protein
VADDDPHRAIVAYLQAHYDDIEPLDDGYSLTGLAYVAAEAPLVEVQNPVLRRFLPDTRFFKTTLSSPYMEYPRVETLVSFRRARGRDDIRTCLSPVFHAASQKFIDQFLGLSASTRPSQRELALAIAELLAEITYRGKARPSPTGIFDGRAELWHDYLFWRVVSVTSDFEGHVDRVFVARAIEPG